MQERYTQGQTHRWLFKMVIVDPLKVHQLSTLRSLYLIWVTSLITARSLHPHNWSCNYPRERRVDFNDTETERNIKSIGLASSRGLPSQSDTDQQHYQ